MHLFLFQETNRFTNHLLFSFYASILLVILYVFYRILTPNPKQAFQTRLKKPQTFSVNLGFIGCTNLFSFQLLIIFPLQL